MKDCINALEAVFMDMAHGKTFNAPRRDSFLVSPKKEAYYSFKTIEGGSERIRVTAQRINSDMINHPVIDGKKRRVKIPAAPGGRYVGLIFLYSTENLELLAILNDGELQRMRVAGSTGVGVRKLARKDSRKAALIGSGWQAGAAVLALAEARPLRTISIYSPNKQNRERLASDAAKKLGIDVVPADSPEEAVRGCDIVAAATNSHSPVVSDKLIKPGMHLSSVRRFEFEDASWKKADLLYFSSPPGKAGFSSYSSQSWRDSSFESDVAQEVLLEERRWKKYKSKTYMLSETLVGRAPGRTSDQQITMFNKNWGLGIEFAAVGKLVYDLAKKKGLGEEIPRVQFSQTSHP
jgi:ornithine cyclodeaminase/alanine dehydrogenase-like protein (mu-crystallin family)